ncbi:hypothetical protein CV093_03150 [Oceanobacillus sp. 143]|nr:hypothetical protein CV093_03150 [Oceanobacillus sp. 143]
MDGNTGEVLAIDMKDNAAETTKKDESAEEEQNATKENYESEDTNKEELTESQESKQQDASKAVISQEEAKNIALQQFNGTFEQIELDEDDGRLSYEIEMKMRPEKQKF